MKSKSQAKQSIPGESNIIPGIRVGQRANEITEGISGAWQEAERILNTQPEGNWTNLKFCTKSTRNLADGQAHASNETLRLQGYQPTKATTHPPQGAQKPKSHFCVRFFHLSQDIWQAFQECESKFHTTTQCPWTCTYEEFLDHLYDMESTLFFCRSLVELKFHPTNLKGLPRQTNTTPIRGPPMTFVLWKNIIMKTFTLYYRKVLVDADLSYIYEYYLDECSGVKGAREVAEQLRHGTGVERKYHTPAKYVSVQRQYYQNQGGPGYIYIPSKTVKIPPENLTGLPSTTGLTPMEIRHIELENDIYPMDKANWEAFQALEDSFHPTTPRPWECTYENFLVHIEMLTPTLRRCRRIIFHRIHANQASTLPRNEDKQRINIGPPMTFIIWKALVMSIFSPAARRVVMDHEIQDLYEYYLDEVDKIPYAHIIAEEIMQNQNPLLPYETPDRYPADRKKNYELHGGFGYGNTSYEIDPPNPDDFAYPSPTPSKTVTPPTTRPTPLQIRAIKFENAIYDSDEDKALADYPECEMEGVDE